MIQGVIYMQITTSGNTITINGTIKSISDFQDIKDVLDSLSQVHSRIAIKIPESISITSAVIGYFTKLKLKNNIAITMHVGDERLFRLLNELNLTQLFNASLKK